MHSHAPVRVGTTEGTKPFSQVAKKLRNSPSVLYDTLSLMFPWPLTACHVDFSHKPGVSFCEMGHHSSAGASLDSAYVLLKRNVSSVCALQALPLPLS